MAVTDFSDNENTDLGFPLSLILYMSNSMEFAPISTMPYNGDSLLSAESSLFSKTTLFSAQDIFKTFS